MGIQLVLPKDVYSRVQEYKSKSGMSHPNLLFYAIESSIEDLPELIKESNVQLPEVPMLFERATSVSKRSGDAEPREIFTIRIKRKHRDLLDELTESTGASSRNAFIVAAYRAFLADK